MRPLRRADLVAGLHIEHAETGDYLGVTLGPPIGPTLSVLDESDPGDPIRAEIDLRSTPIVLRTDPPNRAHE